jgi:hypothetical protein
MMDYFGLIDLGLVVVAAFGFGFWQLWSVNKAIAEDRDKPKGD